MNGHIDFDQAASDAHRLFRSNGWTWWDGEGPDKVPTRMQIEMRFRGMVSSLEANRSSWIKSGRLFARQAEGVDDLPEIEIGVEVVLGSTYR